jgi:tetratricopeptide (TPR) repeat protein
MRYLFLLIILLVWPGSADARWREASSRHFVIYSEDSEANLRKFAEELERLDKAMRVQLRRPDPDRSPATRLTIYVLNDQDRLQGFLGFNGVAGIYFARHSGSLSFTHRGRDRRRSGGLDPKVVLFHEYTHHFLYNNFAFGAPLWFSEGYPEFWSTAEVQSDGAVKFGLPGTHRSLELTEARHINVDRLLTLRHPIRDGETVAAVYGRGWLLSHYLSFEPSRAGQLDAYLMALGRGVSSEEAVAAFGDLNQLERDLRQYLGRSRFSYATLPTELLNPGSITIRELSPGEEAIMSVKMRSKRGVNKKEAQALVPQARRIAERFPEDSAVQVVLAEVEYDADNFAEAEAAADMALAINPNMVDAHLFKARAIWGRLRKAEDKSPDKWREVQRWLGSANRIDPDDPEPLVAFYHSFEASGQQPTRNAVEGLLYAYQLAPEDRELRLEAARQMLRMGDSNNARRALAVITGDSHSGRLGNRMSEVLETLGREGAEAALVRLDAILEELKAESKKS